jgi:hypothetical protein
MEVGEGSNVCLKNVLERNIQKKKKKKTKTITTFQSAYLNWNAFML